MEGRPSDENLAFIGDPSEASVLHVIQKRFERKRIYVSSLEYKPEICSDPRWRQSDSPEPL